MSCCGGNCGCGDGCKCGSGCKGCGRCPDLSFAEAVNSTQPLIVGVSPRIAYFEGSEMGYGIEQGDGCKCGDNCTCNPCTCAKT